MSLSMAGLVCVGVIVVAVKWPFTEANVRQTLATRFARQVTIGRFTHTWFPPGCIVENVRFQHRKRKDLPPLIVASRIVFRAGYIGLLVPPHRIAEVDIAGLLLTVPPDDPNGKNPIMPLTDAGAGNSFGVDLIRTRNARLEMLSSHPGGKTTVLHIDSLDLEHVAEGRPASYRATLESPEPRGQIVSSGHFGPWNARDPGSTAVSGSYTFTNADLSVFHGLSGVLSAKGSLAGHLSAIETRGVVSVPEFHVDGGTASVFLKAEFQAAVNGRNGDTSLENVTAHAARSTLVIHGDVRGVTGQPGKTAHLDLTMTDGRVEDLLRFFSEAKQASMTGAAHFHAQAEIPPGAGFLHKILLKGDFGVNQARFTNPVRQSPVNHLSESARGEKKETQDRDPRDVPERLTGHVETRGGVAALSNISFEARGARARMEGVYNLLNKRVDIHGVLVTDGKLSDATHGFKTLLVKAITPFLKKRHDETLVPFTIRGTSSNPSFGLDLSAKHKL